jgi:hypothetical protein
MFRSDEIEGLVRLLEERETCLYHACQYTDFRSYLTLGGVPSRACLEANSQLFTAFQTDERDHDVEVWDKVFVNFSDFGTTYARGGKGVPNPYGPILLQIRPAALREASEVAICLRPVGAKDFDRSQGSLSSVQDVDRLFRYPAGNGYPESTQVKFSHELARDFFPGAQDPDLSCTSARGILPFEYVSVAVVDHYALNGLTLQAWVKKAVTESQRRFHVGGRSYKLSRRTMLGELGGYLAEGDMSLNSLSRQPSISRELREWVLQINHLDWQFDRFAKYLREGTLLPLLAVVEPT